MVGRWRLEEAVSEELGDKQEETSPELWKSHSLEDEGQVTGTARG